MTVPTLLGRRVAGVRLRRTRRTPRRAAPRLADDARPPPRDLAVRWSDYREDDPLDPACSAAPRCARSRSIPPCTAISTEAEIWLLSWVPGQGTALHDHGLSAGAFAVAQGTLIERVVDGRPARAVRAHELD